MQLVTEANRIFDPSEVRSVYQPIFDLSSRDVVGVEALARWPGLGVSPDLAFGLARDLGRVDELDALCQQAAIDGILGAALPAGFGVFVNVEPDASVRALAQSGFGPGIVVEITERAMLDDPGSLLTSVQRMRERGCGIAIDDVGAVPDSLALLPFLAPDVIKLDLSLVQARPSTEQARILTAISAYAERTGATILAEGIETQRHLDQALALGATVAQGWYFARPGPLGTYPEPRNPIRRLSAPPTGGGTPFDLLDPRALRIGTKGLLLGISHHIEQQGLTLDTPPLVLSAFQDAERMTPDTVRRYAELARRCHLVVALGSGMAAEPAPGVRGTILEQADPLCDEWTVVVVGPHYTGALIAKDLGDGGPDLERRFLFALTHDADTVLTAARLLLGRVDPR